MNWRIVKVWLFLVVEVMVFKVVMMVVVEIFILCEIDEELWEVLG